MTLHVLKMAAGVKSLAALRKQVEGRGNGGPLGIRTKNMPTRGSEVADGGSLYWVAGGSIVARQAVVGFRRGNRADGTPCAVILVSPELVAVSPVPRKAFRGWRYLEPGDAPADLAGTPDMPEEMRAQLASLGLL